jgi:lipopolysaccharide biosynthesis glycosyltransferase
VRQHNPNLPIHLFSDSQQEKVSLSTARSPLTSWENIAHPHRRSKVDYLRSTPFERTLFLDTDTRVLCPLDDLFDLLDRFDVAMAHAHKRAIAAKQATLRITVPDTFPQYNSGVLLYRKTEDVLMALGEWRERFHSEGEITDQKALREILWAGDLRIATLPPEYNVRFLKYLVLWTKDEATPKILHLPYYKEGAASYWKRWRRLGFRALRKILP